METKELMLQLCHAIEHLPASGFQTALSVQAAEIHKQLQESVTLSKKEYDELVNDSEFLNALKAAGVDNWDGYSEAFRIVGDYSEEE